MTPLLKKPKFSSSLFVASSLSAFVIVCIFYLYLSFATSFIGRSNSGSADTYYLKGGISQNDPLLTKRPDLKDMLAGPIISSLDPSLGEIDAPVVIVEFSDFTCAYCQNQERVIKKVMSVYKDKLKLLWKDYPDGNINSISYQAAVAARCAGEQNKFWLYHDALYEQKIRDNDTFTEIADQLKLNKKIFNDCLNSGRFRQLINDNIKEANALDITGVPFVYINDQEVMGEINFEDLEKIIKLELAKAKK